MPVPTKKLVPADWQRNDIAELIDVPASANWSDMGCYKTSTSLWVHDFKMKRDNIEVPSILVITNRSGKGAFFRDVPKTIDGYTILNVDTRKVSMVINGRSLKINGKFPEEITVPHIVVTHYHVFEKCNLGKTKQCETCKGLGLEDFRFVQGTDGSMTKVGIPCTDCKGKGNHPLPETQGDRLLKHHWDVVICDEAHRMKNPDTHWTKNIKKLKCTYKHIMTGTGFINRPDEIFSLLQFLDPKKYSSYWDFRNYFCEIDDWSGWAVVKGCLPHRKAEFRSTVRSYGPRRDKLEVFKDLKEPVYEDIEIELSAEQMRMYGEIKHELETLDKMGYPITSPNVLSQLNRMRQISVATPVVVGERYDPKLERRVLDIELQEPSSKLDALEEIIEGLKWDDDDKQQIVVFSNFNDPLDMLEARLSDKYDKNGKLYRKGTPYIRLNVTDNDDVRMNKWLHEWPKKEHQVFMSTTSLGGESIDLTSAQYMAFLDLSWSPKDNNQARDRIWRPGQTKVPVIFRFFAKDTVDYYVFDKLGVKQGWFNEIFGREEVPEAA
jgi:SNF2-related domain/Helicase conserved C-terminal domain